MCSGTIPLIESKDKKKENTNKNCLIPTRLLSGDVASQFFFPFRLELSETEIAVSQDELSSSSSLSKKVFSLYRKEKILGSSWGRRRKEERAVQCRLPILESTNIVTTASLKTRGRFKWTLSLHLFSSAFFFWSRSFVYL